MNVRGVDFIGFEVTDLERSIAFYRDTLRLTLDHVVESGDWAEFDIGGTTLALCGPKAADWGVPHAGTSGGEKHEGFIALNVLDVRAAVRELKEKGVTVLTDIQDSTVCYFAVIVDPDGNRIWLHQRYAD